MQSHAVLAAVGRKLLRVLFILCLIGGVASYQPALAQSVSGITGVVTDSSGSVVPGVTVKLERPSVGFVKETVTNEGGSFEFEVFSLALVTG